MGGLEAASLASLRSARSAADVLWEGTGVLRGALFWRARRVEMGHLQTEEKTRSRLVQTGASFSSVSKLCVFRHV